MRCLAWPAVLPRRAVRALGPSLPARSQARVPGGRPAGPAAKDFDLVSFPAVPGPGWVWGRDGVEPREGADPGRRLGPGPGAPAGTAAGTPLRRRARSAAATRSRARLAATTGAPGDEQPAVLRSTESRSALDLSSWRPLSQ